MLDAQILAAVIASRAAYERVGEHLTDKDMTPSGGVLWKLVREWYARDPKAPSIDRALLAEQAKSRLSSSKHEDAVLGLLRDLPDSPSPDNAAQVALELKRYNVGMELAAAIGGHDSKALAKLLPKYNDLMAMTELSTKRGQMTQATHIDELYEKVGEQNRVPLAPQALNDRINGGALPGHHVLIFGRPEAGKSTFAINMAGSLVRRGKRVMYFGNEDQIDVLKARMVNRITGLSDEDGNAKPKLRRERFLARGGEDRLSMVQVRHAAVRDLEPEIERFKPDVIFLDQIRNMESADENMTQGLNRIAIQFRSLLLDYGLIGVSVTQANDRTQHSGQEPPIWLGLGDVDSSRTGLPAQADLMLGIGTNTDLTQREQRAVSIPKNKLSSADNSHEGFIVEIDRRRAYIK